MSGKPEQAEREDVTQKALSQLLEHAESMHAIGAYSDSGLDEARRIASKADVRLEATQVERKLERLSAEFGASEP